MGSPLLLVTGTPGIGKTTLVRRVAERLSPTSSMSGFYTEECREGGRRTGFRVVTVEGETGTLAVVGKGEGPHIGRYRVDLESFEEVAIPTLESRPDISLYVIDEIGKMECLSDRFVEAVRALLDAEVPLLASVALRGPGFIEEVKAHPRAELIRVTRENRDALVSDLAGRLNLKDHPQG